MYTIGNSNSVDLALPTFTIIFITNDKFNMKLWYMHRLGYKARQLQCNVDNSNRSQSPQKQNISTIFTGGASIIMARLLLGIQDREEGEIVP